jgi:hypothetical protein
MLLPPNTGEIEQTGISSAMPSMLYRNLSISTLTSECADVRTDRSHENFCLELFRRAIAEHSPECWSAIYAQYRKLVIHWILECLRSGRELEQSTLDELVLGAFTAFWQGFTSEKLQRAEGLASVLKYLKSCAFTAVLQFRRRAATRQERSLEPLADDETAGGSVLRSPSNVEREILHAQQAHHLWEIVDHHCADDRERLLARLSFVADLTPSRIMALHPGIFGSAEEIYALRRNLRNRLMQNPQLRRMQQERE